MTYELTTAEWRSPRGKRLMLTYRADTNDWNTVSSTLTHDEYGLAELRMEGWAFDIGGYLGSVAIALAVDNPELYVLCVEPVPMNVDLIDMNIVANHVEDRVVIVEGMVGPPRVKTAIVRHSYRGNEALEHHAFVGNTSLVYELAGVEEHDETKVPVYSHRALVKMAGALPSFVKIDCEGGEWGYLTDATVAAVPRIRGEWHPVPYLGKGMTRDDLVTLLPEHDITFTGPEAGPGGFEAVLRG